MLHRPPPPSLLFFCQIGTYFGEVKTYGEDYGGSREGRRYFVPDYEYVDEQSDVTYRRVRFNLEGDRGRKATVWAELRAGSSDDFRYLLVMSKDRSRVWSVIDRRAVPPSTPERQAAVSSLIAGAGWTFYAADEADAARQAAELGDYALKVKVVRGAEAARAAEEQGVRPLPAWTTGRSPPLGYLDAARDALAAATGAERPPRPEWRVARGVKTLRELEVMAKELRPRPDEGYWKAITRAVGMA